MTFYGLDATWKYLVVKVKNYDLCLQISPAECLNFRAPRRGVGNSTASFFLDKEHSTPKKW